MKLILLVKSPTILSVDDDFPTNFSLAILSDNKGYVCLHVIETKYIEEELLAAPAVNYNNFRMLAEKAWLIRIIFIGTSVDIVTMSQRMHIIGTLRIVC